ncbi:MAG: glycosyltransferase family 2 protein [Elusimicrobia bacterium]|nr:glycosyltransferase family 2 protein [Elusimicrobiota bacterium]
MPEQGGAVSAAQSLTIIVPAYNEAKTIRRIVEKLFSVPLPARLEVIVVDDGSSDGTGEALDGFANPGLKVLRHASNQGKGAAIRTALAAASGDYTLIQDADLEYDPDEIPLLLKAAAEKKAPVVYGSRVLKQGNTASYFRYYLGGRFISFWTNLLFFSSITDEPTCYKLFRTDLLRSFGLKCRGFEFCPEVTGKTLRRGIPIVEVPISYRPRSIEEGKKIRFKDGVIAIWTLLKIRLFG